MNDKAENSNLSNFKITIANSLIVTTLVVICLQFIGSLISIPAFFWKPLNHITLPLSFFVGGLLAIFTLKYYLKINWKTVSAHIWKPVSLGVVFLSILLYFLSLPFAEFLSTMVPTTGIPWLEELYKSIAQTFEMILDYPVAGFITICILAPIIEEILFRGILLRGLLQNKVSPILSIFLSSLLFGAAHLNPWQFLGAGMLGAVFGFVYYRTKSLWLVMFLHALNNTISFFMMSKFKTLDENVTNPNDYTSVSLCFGGAIIIGWFIYKLTQNKISWS